MGNKGLSEETVEKHESYGMVSINRTSSGGTYLFGSIMNHHSFITLTIKHAKVRRHLAQDWYSADSLPIVEIELSHTQFAELITSPGIGDGVPCTIRGLNGKLLKECPAPEAMNSKYAEDLKKTTASTVVFCSSISSLKDCSMNGMLSVTDCIALLMPDRRTFNSFLPNVLFPGSSTSESC